MAHTIDVKPYLNKIDSLIASMHFVSAEVGLSPAKEHIITCLKYQGLNQMRTEFVRRLVNSIVKYVFSEAKMTEVERELIEDEGLDEGDIHAELFQQARGYFRASDVKGQFSELLLFNLLQYHFQAIPVVRKMVITTNPEVERHGADAIHLGQDDSIGNVIYLGEAKTYPSGFKAAFENAIKSIITAYDEHRNELQLYKYEEFLEPSVRRLMKDYLNGKIDLPVRLVVIVSYCSGETPEQTSKEDYIKHYIEDVLQECKKIKSGHFKDTHGNPMNAGLLAELNYILFPVNELEELLEEFKTKLGLS
jgi:hypothetical protein